MRLWGTLALLVLTPAVLGQQAVFPYNKWNLFQIDSLLPIFNHLNLNIPEILNHPDKFNILEFNTAQGTTVVAVALKGLQEFIDKLNMAGIPFITLSENLAELLGGGLKPFPFVRADFLQDGKATFDRYMNYREIINYIEDLPSKHPEKIQVENIGRSSEGRPIKLITVNKKRDESNDEKPVIFVEAGSNAREWVSPASALYLVEKLLESRAMARNFEWKIVPLLNPDGYVYSWEHDRLWVKNRARTSLPECVGVDLNRNYDFQWGQGIDVNPCSSFYQGSEPFSEPEAKAIKEALSKVQERTKAYVSLRAYGQKVKYPVTSSSSNKKDGTTRMRMMAEGMTKKIQAANNVEYTVAQSDESAAIGGASSDWVASQGVPRVFTIQLRDDGHTVFNLPEELITPTGEDLWSAMKYLGRQVKNRKKRNKN